MEENQSEQPEYEILPDDYPKYDLSFKIIIIAIIYILYIYANLFLE